LRESGWSDDCIDAAIRAGRIVRVARDALVPRQRADELWARCEAALSTQRRDAAISRRTAAVADGFLWVPDEWTAPDHPICVTAEREDTTRSSRKGLDRRIARLPDEDVRLWQGLRICTAARTAVDLARFEQRLLALQLLDGALRAGKCTREDLVAVMDRMVRVPNVRRARELVDLAREGVDSPPETTTRLAIVDAGLPMPDVNLRIFSPLGDLLFQGDLGYWRWLIWIDYDGKAVHDPLWARGDQQRRDRRLQPRGWHIMHVDTTDLPPYGSFIDELEVAIADAPARVAGLNPARSPEIAAAQRLLGLR
jgi:hypothetical protein